MAIKTRLQQRSPRLSTVSDRLIEVTKEAKTFSEYNRLIHRLRKSSFHSFMRKRRRPSSPSSSVYVVNVAHKTQPRPDQPQQQQRRHSNDDDDGSRSNSNSNRTLLGNSLSGPTMGADSLQSHSGVAYIVELKTHWRRDTGHKTTGRDSKNWCMFFLASLYDVMSHHLPHKVSK